MKSIWSTATLAISSSSCPVIAPETPTLPAVWPALVGLAIFPLLAGLIWIHGRLVGHAGTGSEDGKRELQPAGRSA